MTIGIIIAVIVIILVLYFISANNRLIRLRNKVLEARSGIEVALTKRFDTLTKLQAVAKGYGAREERILTEAIRLRKGMSVAELSEADAQMGQAQSRLLALAENYPALTSAPVYQELQSVIRDCEQHLQAARRAYNSNVTLYNSMQEMFPSSIVAGMKHLQKEDLYHAEAEKLQDVRIDL